MTSSVKAVPSWLPLKSFSQRMSLSLIPPFSFFTLHYTPHSETVTAAKKVEKKNHCVSQIGTCSAHDKVKWTVIYFIFAVVIVVIDMHIVLSPHLV